jgi:hypothetical protein
MNEAELVSPEFEVDGVPCKSNKDMVKAGVGLPRDVQFVVKMRAGEHRVAAVRRYEQKLAAALAHMTGAQTFGACASYLASPASLLTRGLTCPWLTALWYCRVPRDAHRC